MGAVTVPLLPDVAWHGESFGNSCLTTRNHSLLYEAMCTWFGFTQLLPLLAKRRDQTHLTDSGPTAVTTTWSAGSLPPKMHGELVSDIAWYGWPKWTKSAKGSTYEKFHVRKHTRIKSFVYKTIRIKSFVYKMIRASKVSCIKWYAYQKLRERFHTCMFKDQSKLPIPYTYVFIRVTFNTRCFYYV